jgi:hypothetical protein
MPPPQRGPRPAPVTDIDRFLQEVDRLRRKAGTEQQQQKPAKQDEVLEVLPAENPPPVFARPRPKPQSQQRKFDDVVVVPTARPASRPIPAPPPKQSSTPFPTTGVESIATVATVATIATISIPSAPEAAGQSRTKSSLSTPQVLALLRGGNIRAAILLREILDPPLCRRKR